MTAVTIPEWGLYDKPVERSQECRTKMNDACTMLIETISGTDNPKYQITGLVAFATTIRRIMIDYQHVGAWDTYVREQVCEYVDAVIVDYIELGGEYRGIAYITIKTIISLV